MATAKFFAFCQSLSWSRLEPDPLRGEFNSESILGEADVQKVRADLVGDDELIYKSIAVSE